MKCTLTFALAALAAAASAQAETCFQTLAATRNFTLGQPVHALPSPDGRRVLFLRSGPRDTKLGLFAMDLATHAVTALAQPAATEHLSVEERARRERLRMTLTGITDFAFSEDGARVLVSQGDHLSVVALPGGAVSAVPGAGWIAPHLSPDGRFVEGVRDNDVHVVELATRAGPGGHHRRHRCGDARAGGVRGVRGAGPGGWHLVVAGRRHARL